MSGPALWYANRGTGVALLVLYTLTVLLGISATGRGPGPRWLPRFLVQGLHRNLALLSTLLLAVHIASAVVDDYVDISWRDALVPWGGSYRPLYLGLGAVSLDLFIAVGLTSVVRGRLPDRAWRLVHLLAYPSWGVSVVHGVGIGTDANDPAFRWLVAGCLAVVVLAGVVRGVARLVPQRS